MIQKFAVLSGLVLSATCMVLHQPSLPLILGLQYNDNPSYNFAYEVNDAHTGDIKNQHESRRGDAVLGQYSLVQPDGLRRIVDYRADDHTGFQATVNNNGRVLEASSRPDLAHSYPKFPATSVTYPSSAPTASAVSRTSFVQTISHSPAVHNPWP